MIKRFITACLLLNPFFILAQNQMTPELLWQLGRVQGLGVSNDGKYVLYSVKTPRAQTNNSSTLSYLLPLNGGMAIEISNPDSLLTDRSISPDGQYRLSNKEVKIKKISGRDHYPELTQSNVYIYDNLNNRHWDTWEDGSFDHVFIKKEGDPTGEKDIMPGEPFDCPTKPFGGSEDYTWRPDGKAVIYVCKKKYGAAYALSTNSDLYEYDLATGITRNLTESNKGYDISPSFSSKGALAWLSMRREGYEADKQDLVVTQGTTKNRINLTAHRDDIHVEGYRWNDDGNSIFFWAATNGTEQLFEVAYDPNKLSLPVIKQVTNGDFDITGIVGQSGHTLVVSRTDFNHATELYSLNTTDGSFTQLTHVNDAIYNTIGLCRTERRWIKTSDAKEMLVWVVYPPGFDPNKKYPTLLFCEGGPQSPLTQFYSFRWNLQLMASQGYIVIAPNRRGMPGHGTKWNEAISKDHGGQAIKDYLSAVDALCKEKFVDKSRLGCVGASYGGYSVFMLAGMHHNRFKTFIAHDGIFDMRSMYGTTEEMWFVNWDWGGPYWDKKNAAAQKSYSLFNPINFVDKWNTPILIVQGGKDYRVPVEQGLQAFQAAQLRGIKSKLLYLPEENHWVLSAQNALVWQHEFFSWLKETMPEKD